MQLTRMGIDIAKQVFQVHGVDRHEQPVWRRRLSREQFLKTVLATAGPGCEIGMEACGGANHWARQLQAHGYHVKLIAPQFVKPYVKSNKNDANDAEAICEAMSRPSMRFVQVKSIVQQDLQALHRIGRVWCSNVLPRTTRPGGWSPSTGRSHPGNCSRCAKRSRVGWRTPTMA